MELVWRLKVFSGTSNLWFWISPYQGTLSCSYILKPTQYMLSIANEVDSLIFWCVCFVCDANMYFSIKWYQSGLQFWICITCFVSFGIRDNSFMILEDYTFNFLHGCWNYCLMKTNIDVLMFFKFEFKYVKLNFKAIISMEFSFDIKF